MLAAFPRASEVIDRARRTTLRMFRADTARAPRPFTLAAGPDGRPVVVLRYRGRIGDLITVAHEFGHAVQIAASGNGFVPPVNREICAFVSELALLRHLGAELPAAHGPARGRLGGAQRRLPRPGCGALALALKDPESVYRYAWNYPIARILASDASPSCRSTPSGRSSRTACRSPGSPRSSAARIATARPAMAHA